MRGVWFAGEPGLRVRDVLAIRPSRNFEDDGRVRERARAGESPRKIDCRSSQRWRSSPLFPRQGCGGKILADWPPGIACAFWFKPVKRAPAPGRRRRTEKRDDGGTAAL